MSVNPKEVFFVSPFVPREWIAAHGLRPRTTFAQGPDRIASGRAGMGVCPFAESFLETATTVTASGALAIFVTTCDQMRRAADQMEEAHDGNAFLMNVPATWQSPSALQLYRSEIERLGAFLVRHGGTSPAPDRLAAEMHRTAQGRAALLPARPSLASDLGSTVSKTIPLAIVGESLLPSHRSLLGVLETLRGRVALDATGSGERSFPCSFDESRIDRDPFTTLVNSYFTGVLDVSQRPNSRFYDWLRSRVTERSVRGIVLWHYSWCDLWRAEANRLRDECQLPLLHLDLGDAVTPAMNTRIEAFLETLHS